MATDFIKSNNCKASVIPESNGTTVRFENAEIGLKCFNYLLNKNQIIMENVTNLPDNVVFAYDAAGYENRELSQKEIAKMLDNHSVGRTWANGKLMAGDDCDGDGIEILTDTTNWTLFDMLAFLGY